MWLDIEKKLSWCLPCAARSTAGRQRTVELSPFKVPICNHTVAADIFGPVTIAARSRTKCFLVLMGLFTKYAISVQIATTEAKNTTENCASLGPSKWRDRCTLHGRRKKLWK